HIQEGANTGEVHYAVQLGADLIAAHAENRAIQVDVLSSSQLRMETSPHFNQRGQPASDLDLPVRRSGNTGQQLEDGALPRTIVPNDSDRFATSHGKADVPQRPKLLATAAQLSQSAHPRVKRLISVNLLLNEVAL